MIYKILTADQWEQFEADGQFEGAPIDRADGFIHFSALDQVAGTLEKHFDGQTGLVVVEVDERKVPDDQLKWEVSRGGEKFPHLYGSLCRDAVVSITDASDYS
ncbi:MAG: DUF952 domain-containing protein [Planctomycetota bacterium]